MTFAYITLRNLRKMYALRNLRILHMYISNHYLSQFKRLPNKHTSLKKHSPIFKDVASCRYLQVNQSEINPLEFVRTFLNINRSASNIPYFTIISSTSYEKLTNIMISYQVTQYEHLSQSLAWHLGSRVWSLFVPIYL